MWSWPALLLTPIIALANLAITYALVTPSCEAQSDNSILHIVTLISFLVAAAMTGLAWMDCRQLAASGLDDNSTVRRRFIAAVALYTGILFLQVIVSQWIAIGLLSPCLS
jgi:hypothetical protein